MWKKKKNLLLAPGHLFFEDLKVTEIAYLSISACLNALSYFPSFIKSYHAISDTQYKLSLELQDWT